MLTEQQQEQASAFALGALSTAEEAAFVAELRASAELREMVRHLQRTAGLLSKAMPQTPLPPGLRDKVLRRIDAEPPTVVGKAMPAPHRFVAASEEKGWKQLPVPGARIKLLSLDRERGYAVLLGKLDPGTRYPAHINAGPEDFCVLTGDLYVGEARLGPGDYHHADAGSQHEENYSVEGCTLIAVLTTDDPLVAFAAS